MSLLRKWFFDEETKQLEEVPMRNDWHYHLTLRMEDNTTEGLVVSGFPDEYKPSVEYVFRDFLKWFHNRPQSPNYTFKYGDQAAAHSITIRRKNIKRFETKLEAKKVPMDAPIQKEAAD